MSTTYQNPLTLLNADAIPEASKPLLEAVSKKFGFVPTICITHLSTLSSLRVRLPKLPTQALQPAHVVSR